MTAIGTHNDLKVFALRLKPGRQIQATFEFTPETGAAKGTPQRTGSATYTVDPAGAVLFNVNPGTLTKHHQGVLDGWLREADDNVNGPAIKNLDGIELKFHGVPLP